jgi:hypothetical protein
MTLEGYPKPKDMDGEAFSKAVTAVAQNYCVAIGCGMSEFDDVACGDK